MIDEFIVDKIIKVKDKVKLSNIKSYYGPEYYVFLKSIEPGSYVQVVSDLFDINNGFYIKNLSSENEINIRLSLRNLKSILEDLGEFEIIG